MKSEPTSNYINFEPTWNDQKLLLLYIIVSFRSIIWAWSHNSYKRVSTKFRCSNIKMWYLEEISITSDAKKMNDYIKYQKLLLHYIVVSFQLILWPWSHNSYKWVQNFDVIMSKYVWYVSISNCVIMSKELTERLQ